MSIETCLECEGSGEVLCTTCGGEGHDAGEDCPDCDGEGAVMCTECDGTGEVDDGEEDED